jgi:hypothetical protein
MVRCVECDTRDHPLRVVPMSCCQHRVCVFSSECREKHVASCPEWARPGSEPPAAPDTGPVQLDLFGEVA